MSERTLPIRFDFTGEDALVQGSYWSRRFAFEYEDGTLWNTGGYTARMQVRKADDSLVWTFTTAGPLGTGISVSNGVQSNFRIIISHTVLANISDWGLARYDVELTDTEGRTFRVLEGYLTVSREITKDTDI